MYEYGNTRFRAMKSRLLSRDKIESLANAENLQALIEAVLRTRYRSALEEALARVGGVRAVNRGTRLALTSVLERMREYYEGRARELIDLVLGRYDVENVKTILRGLQNRLSTEEIIQAFGAFGALDESILREISQADQPREAIDRMATLQLPTADPLVVYRAQHPGATPFELELALERWYFQNVADELRSPKRDEKALLSALEMDADMDNLMTALRFAQVPDQRRYLAEERELELPDLLLEFGSLSISELQEAGEQDSVENAIEVLEYSPYDDALANGLETYQNTGQLSAIERALRQHRLGWMQQRIFEDPLGISVPLGVLTLRMNEVSNLRWIAWGLQLGLSPQEIRRDLEFPS